MADIVDTEKNRLLLKKQNVDNALEGRKRAALLNDSYRQRYAEYTKMIIVVVFTLVIFVALTLLGRYVTIIPSFIIELLCIITIAIGLFMCYFIYLDIAGRDKLNYNEINLDGPSILTPNQIAQNQKTQAAAGNLLGTIKLQGCIGNDCCSTGTVWDASNSVCIVGTGTSGSTVPGSRAFSTMSIFYATNGVTPNSPNEFENYMVV
jgi:hypothetical protein